MWDEIKGEGKGEGAALYFLSSGRAESRQSWSEGRRLRRQLEGQLGRLLEGNYLNTLRNYPVQMPSALDLSSEVSTQNQVTIIDLYFLAPVVSRKKHVRVMPNWLTYRITALARTSFA